MAMEITSNYNAYESTYAAQKQETAKNQAASGKETLETVVAQKKFTVGNGKAKSTTDYEYSNASEPPFYRLRAI